MRQIVLNQMVYQQQRGHEVTALCPDDEWTKEIKTRGIRVIHVPFERHSLPATLSAAVRTWSICRQKQFDLVHTHNSLPGIAGRLAARAAGVPAVIHTCHAWPLHQPRSPLFFYAYRILETLAARAAHAVLFQNTDDMRSCVDLKVVPGNKATLIGNGIDLAQLLSKVGKNSRLRIRNESGISDTAFVWVKVARLELPKGHLFLLEALKHLVPRLNREVVVLFVGIGEDEDRIKSEVERLGLQQTVRFTGYRHDIPDILAAADASVLTSFFEGVPRALMESMALGLPVVATDVPGTRMLVQPGKTGLLVEYDHVEGLVYALIQVMENPALAKRLGQAGQRLVQSAFDERLVVERILQVYDHVLNGGKGPLPQWDLGWKNTPIN